MSDRRRSPDRRRRRSSSPRRASPRRRRYISPRGSPSREYSEDHYYRFTSHESREYRRSPERRRRFTGGRDQSANREPERSYRRERYNRSISREPCSSPGSGRSYSRREPDRSYSRERGSPQRRRSSSRHKHMSSSRESDRCYSRESSSYSSNRNRSVAREPYSSPEKRTFSSSGRGRSPSQSSICSDHSSPIYKASSSENDDSSLSSEKRNLCMTWLTGAFADQLERSILSNLEDLDCKNLNDEGMKKILSLLDLNSYYEWNCLVRAISRCPKTLLLCCPLSIGWMLT